MAVPKVLNAQRDFSGGEADAWAKRADDRPEHKTVARQMSNWRPLSSRALANRPGRRLLGTEHARCDEVVMSPGNSFYLTFSDSTLRVYNEAFARVFDTTGVFSFPWVDATVKDISWDVYKLSVYICFDGMRPQILTWDGVSQTSSWTLIPYRERVGTSGQKRTVFYRLSPPDIAMRPSAQTGVVNVPFSPGMNLVSGMVGTRMRFAGRQFTIASVINATNATATVNEQLYNAFNGSTGAVIGTGADLRLSFSIGDEIIGAASGAKAVVVDFSPDGLTVLAQSINSPSFTVPETFVGPTGSAIISSITHAGILFTSVWDDEVMNDFRGYPRACFIDQGRLGFCDFPALPQLIVWSAVGDFTDLYTDENNVGPTNAIQELVPGKSRVLYVVPGAEGSEFVFCDNACHYIPINQSNPLKPGSVAFNTLMAEGIAQVQPRPVQSSIVFVSAGGTQIKAVQAVGAYSRPYIVDGISDLHSHLLHTPIAIAAPGGSNQFEENYFYVGNADGSLILCNFSIKGGVIDTKSLGWLPWSGGGTATWVSALKGHSDVLITSIYAPNGVTPHGIVEIVDATQYLDAAMLYNAVPASVAPPVGKGPLFWLAGGSVDLMDGRRMMGTYLIDANGFLVPQNNAGEDFTSATLTAGQAWTAILEPFVPSVQPGQDVQQRLRKRRVARFAVHVQDSSGFTMCRLFGGPITRTSPAAGTIMQRRRIEAWNQDDDPTLAPPLREQAYSERPIGRFHDPRVAIIKDTPGSLTVLEIDLEVSI